MADNELDQTPHDYAMTRCEQARKNLREAEAAAKRIVSEAEAELGQAMAELARYEKEPGIPLSVEQQHRIKERYETFQRKFGEAHPER